MLLIVSCITARNWIQGDLKYISVTLPYKITMFGAHVSWCLLVNEALVLLTGSSFCLSTVVHFKWVLSLVSHDLSRLSWLGNNYEIRRTSIVFLQQTFFFCQVINAIDQLSRVLCRPSPTWGIERTISKTCKSRVVWRVTTFLKYYYFLQNSGWVYGAQKLQDCGIFT